jgi:fermentation-respiration switch protein FrsA (DUF1100 family)
MTKVLLLLAISIPALCCQGCVGRMFYHPDRTNYGTPSRYGLTYEEVTFQSKDGTKLTGWFIPAVGAPRGTVIHFHGNAQNMSAHFAFVSWLPAAGFNLFVFDYRGYGQSEGKPDRRGLFEDSVAAITCVQARKDVDRDRLLILGQSLGGANAITAVGNNSFKGIRAVAIESAFSSYRDIVRDKIGRMPLLSLLKWPLSYLLIADSYSPDRVVRAIAPVPLLLIYGTDDGVVPYHHGQELFARAQEPKQLWTIEHGGHTEAFAEESSGYRQKLVNFFATALDGKSTAATQGRVTDAAGDSARQAHDKALP